MTGSEQPCNNRDPVDAHHAGIHISDDYEDGLQNSASYEVRSDSITDSLNASVYLSTSGHLTPLLNAIHIQHSNFTNKSVSRNYACQYWNSYFD